MNFTITHITKDKVFAKTVNPYGEKPITGFTPQGVSIECWQEAENNLKEYELTEKNPIVDHKVIYEAEGGSHCIASFMIFEIGQTISGTLITEDGKQKIQL